MRITSIFSEETGTGIIQLLVSEECIKLLTTWQSSPSDSRLIEALTPMFANLYLVNGVLIGGKLQSALAEVLRDRNFSPVRVLPPAHTIASMEVLRELQAKDEFQATNWNEWMAFSAEIARLSKHKTPRAMALLQAIILADKKRRGVESVVGAYVERRSPYVPEPQPQGDTSEGYYIPVSQWGNGRM